MAFRTRRQHRYQILRDTGFLPFEAKALSKIPFNVPYIDAMIKDRYKQVKEAGSEKVSQREWERRIKGMYVDRNFTKTDKKTGRITLDPWQMMRDFEFKYKAKHPDYESPWEKRRKNWKDFMAKIERTYSKYPEGAAYNKKAKPGTLKYLPQGGAELIKEQAQLDEDAEENE